MPPAAKRRRLAVSTTESASTAPAPQRGIQSFGKISKSHLLPQNSAKDVALGDDTPCGGSGAINGSRSTVTKRKLVTFQETAVKEEAEAPPRPSSPPKNCQVFIESISTPACIASSPSLPSLSQPATPRKRSALRPKTAATPTQGARSCLESLAIASSSSSDIKSSPAETVATPPTSPVSVKSPCPIRNRSVKLPIELLDLIDLHSSFLTALSLHYAHHGSLTPADLRILRLSIERSWGKRRIYTDDIRRILGILYVEDFLEAPKGGQKHRNGFSLSDYGSGKICVEIADTPMNREAHRRPIDEETMKILFTRNLARLWEQHRKSADDSLHLDDFFSQLPLANIFICSSGAKISPLLAKGQQRLSDLKTGAIKVQKEKVSTAKDPTAVTQSPKALNNRSQTLLERILAKQLHQSSLPAGPSPELLARKSALQRLEEIIPVIEILTSSGSTTQYPNRIEVQKFSLTMPTLVQHLQNSLRNPISKDEVERCVTLLAEEVAPGWIRARRIGKVVGLTVDLSGAVGRDEMRQRISKALDG
ncbi:hypothetical protein MMC08_004863 [Hypocenomyce scalaris]|nr:hypothetical protein [Hypocenomyce scalaris]